MHIFLRVDERAKLYFGSVSLACFCGSVALSGFCDSFDSARVCDSRAGVAAGHGGPVTTGSHSNGHSASERPSWLAEEYDWALDSADGAGSGIVSSDQSKSRSIVGTFWCFSVFFKVSEKNSGAETGHARGIGNECKKKNHLTLTEIMR